MEKVSDQCLGVPNPLQNNSKVGDRIAGKKNC